MVDVVLAAIFLAAGFWGLRQGLLRSLIGLVGNIAALVLAWLAKAPVAAALDERLGATAAIAGKLASWLPLPEALSEMTASLDGVGRLYTWLEATALPKDMRMGLIQAVQEAVAAKPAGLFETMAETVAKVAAQYLWLFVVFLGLWLILAVAITFGSRLLVGVVHHLPIIGAADKLGGALVGLLLTALTFAVLYSVLELVVGVSTLSDSQSWLTPLAQSRILPALKGFFF